MGAPCLAPRASDIDRLREEERPTQLDPIAQLMDDHQRYLRRLSEFNQAVAEMTPLARFGPAEVRRVDEFADFLRDEVDALHGQKEETGLFPVLARRLPSEEGPVGMLIEEHVGLRDHQQALARWVEAVSTDPEAGERFEPLRRAEETIRSLLTDHIQKEDLMLFPSARDVLRPPDLEEIDRVFREVEEQARQSKRSPRA